MGDVRQTSHTSRHFFPELSHLCSGCSRLTMTSTLSRTNSAAISMKRSLRPSARRYSIAMVRPSIQPISRSRCNKAVIRWLSTAGVVGPKYPMVGIFAACCAPAPIGHAAAPPSSVMNVRRLIGTFRPPRAGS